MHTLYMSSNAIVNVRVLLFGKFVSHSVDLSRREAGSTRRNSLKLPSRYDDFYALTLEMNMQYTQIKVNNAFLSPSTRDVIEKALIAIG